MRIVFFGTPQFAVPALQVLLAGGFEISAVVTQPDRPRGRSRSNLVPPPVKSIALDLDIPVLQPEKPAGDVFSERLRRLEPDLGVVVAYGHLLRPDILAIPRLGMINVHASLLPRLRGAAPIQWAILNGESETGVSIMQMESGLDSGPVYHRARVPIGEEETAGELAHRLAQLGATTLLETVNGLQEGTVRATAQDAANVTYAPKVDRSLCRVRWTETALQCSRRIRAFDPEPGAWTHLEGTEIKLFGAAGPPKIEAEAASGAPGSVLRAGTRLSIMAGDGPLTVREVQPAGKKRMPVSDWLRGRELTPGVALE